MVICGRWKEGVEKCGEEMRSYLKEEKGVRVWEGAFRVEEGRKDFGYGEGFVGGGEGRLE